MSSVESKNIWQNTLGELPNKGYITFSVMTNDPESKLKLVKEVMAAISSFDEDNWPDDHIWDHNLPKWFLEKIKQNSLELIKEDQRLWNYGSWLDALKFRGWKWFSSTIKPSGFEIILEPYTLPYSVG